MVAGVSLARPSHNLSRPGVRGYVVPVLTLEVFSRDALPGSAESFGAEYAAAGLFLLAGEHRSMLASALAALLLIAGCRTIPTPLPPAAAELSGHLSAVELRNLRHIQRIHEPGLGLVRRLRESGLLADSAEWWVAGPRDVLPFAGSWRGIDGIVEFENQLGATMRYDKVEIRQYLVSGNEVVAVFFAEGVARATGKPFRGEILRVYSFSAEKVVRVRNYYDTHAYVRAVRGEP